MKRVWIDTHAHVCGEGLDGKPRAGVAEGLAAMLDGSDADLRLVACVDMPALERMKDEPEAILDGNRMVRDLIRQAPGRLFGGCVVNPRFFKESERAVRMCFEEWGFVMFGEMLQYLLDFRMDCAETEKLVRLAEKYGAPTQVHISTSNRLNHNSTHGDDQLRDLFGLAKRTPEVRYILAHAVGMPKGDPPVVDGYLDMVEAWHGGWPENFWMEIRDFNSPGVVSALRRVPSNRLLAGTDWTTRVGPPFAPYLTVFGVERPEDNPFPPRVSEAVRFLKSAGASDEDVERIAWKNAVELFGDKVSARR